MALNPIKIHNDTNQVDVYDTFCHQHSTIDMNIIDFVADESGMTNLNHIRLDCPVCNSQTVHPISGGGAPEEVQKLFIHLLRRRQPGRTWEQAKTLAKVLISNQDGPDRWKSENVQEDDE